MMIALYVRILFSKTDLNNKIISIDLLQMKTNYPFVISISFSIMYNHYQPAFFSSDINLNCHTHAFFRSLTTAKLRQSLFLQKTFLCE